MNSVSYYHPHGSKLFMLSLKAYIWLFVSQDLILPKQMHHFLELGPLIFIITKPFFYEYTVKKEEKKYLP